MNNTMRSLSKRSDELAGIKLAERLKERVWSQKVMVKTSITRITTRGTMANRIWQSWESQRIALFNETKDPVEIVLTLAEMKLGLLTTKAFLSGVDAMRRVNYVWEFRETMVETINCGDQFYRVYTNRQKGITEDEYLKGKRLIHATEKFKE